MRSGSRKYRRSVDMKTPKPGNKIGIIEYVGISQLRKSKSKHSSIRSNNNENDNENCRSNNRFNEKYKVRPIVNFI